MRDIVIISLTFHLFLAQYKDIINDYRMNLLEVNSMDNLESYRGE